MPANRIQQAAWILAAVALLLVLQLHLLPTLLAGLLVFELVHLLAPRLESHLSSQRAKLAVVILLAVVVVSGTVAAIVGAVAFFNGHGGLQALAHKMAEAVDNARQWLPDWLLAMLPENIDEAKESAAHWLRSHAGEVGVVGKEAGIGFAHVLVGMVIGAMVALHEAVSPSHMRPLAAALAERAHRLAEAFRRIVFAQVRISALNTFFTALYLGVALPLADSHLPLAKTLVALTFCTGLLPVVGNLISNTVIVTVSLAVSPAVAAASLVFLVVVHKLEYFLNARIVGDQIAAKAWELLLAMLVMEAAFGLAGLVAAPVYYAYAKDELAAAGLV